MSGRKGTGHYEAGAIETLNDKVKKIEQDTDRNFFMAPDESKEYGLIDTVFEPKEK